MSDLEDTQESLEEFLRNIYESCRLWYEIHTDEKTWIDYNFLETMGFDEIKHFLYGIYNNDDYRVCNNDIPCRDEFNAALLEYFKQSSMEICEHCGMILDRFEICNCEETEIERKSRKFTDDDEFRIADYIDSIREIPDVAIEDYILPELFKLYREYAVYYTAEIEYDLEQAFLRLGNATDNSELLTEFVYMLHIMHVSGNIVRDYGIIDYKDIDIVQQKGLTYYFPEAVEVFLNQELFQY